MIKANPIFYDIDKLVSLTIKHAIYAVLSSIPLLVYYTGSQNSFPSPEGFIFIIIGVFTGLALIFVGKYTRLIKTEKNYRMFIILLLLVATPIMVVGDHSTLYFFYFLGFQLISIIMYSIFVNQIMKESNLT